jgi:chaperonin GroES
MNFKPIGDRIIVKRCEENKMIGNIITLNPEPSQFFEVMAISDEINESQLKIGDTILLPKYGYNTVELEGIVYGIVKVEDILAVKS